MRFIIDNQNNIIFYMEEKIDSNNSSSFTNEVEKEITNESKVIFDFINTKYISSAGLRFVLKISKESKEFSIINVNNDVYSIFEMTGFTSILKISKAMTKVSISNHELIGQGATANVYRLTADSIVKVFDESVSLESIEEEVELSKKAFVLGVPTAIPFNIVKIVEGGYGIVYELLNCEPLNKVIANDIDNLDYYIQFISNLVKSVNSIEGDNEILHSKKDKYLSLFKELKNDIITNDILYDKILNLLNTIPERRTLVHGDLHIKNIMVENGNPLLIDLGTLGYGHPIFEIGSMRSAYISFAEVDIDNAKKFFGVDGKITRQIYQKCLEDIYKDKACEVDKKASIISYISVLINLKFYIGDKEALHKHTIKQLEKLVDELDTLEY